VGNGVSGGGDSERNAWIGGVSARGLPAGCRGEGFGWLGSGGPDRSLNRLHPWLARVPCCVRWHWFTMRQNRCLRVSVK
jgi:hypothetical protein